MLLTHNIVLNKDGNLDINLDPKEAWAKQRPEFYPVRINKADRESLLRVPGIEQQTADIILKTRHNGKINNLNALGLKGKRLDKIQRYIIFE